MNTTPWLEFPDEVDGSDFPAVGMNFDEVLQFLDRLSKADGATYDLPTEPEWETACRGTAHQNHPKSDQEGWNSKTSGGRLNSVAQKPANPIGLYDMVGNAAEWTRDRYYETWHQQPLDFLPRDVGSLMTIRGGHWADPPEDCQPWSRRNADTDGRQQYVGIRLVLRNIPSTATKTR